MARTDNRRGATPAEAVQLETLRTASVPPRQAEFAGSLINQAGGGLTDRQWYWIGELARQVSGAEPAPATTNVGSVKGIVDLLDRAKQHLKYPALLVRANDRDIRLNIAGSSAQAPGTINVCSAVRDSAGQRRWFGRITVAGEYEPSRRIEPAMRTPIAAALAAMASDPAKAASEYGRLTGHCCFCTLPLTDPRSTAVGYGKICARNYDLPWGTPK
jgi:hypothetical protein